MGVALYVVLEKDATGCDATSVPGKCLARAQDRLDAIAKERGLTPLGDFLSIAPEEAMAFLEGEGVAPEGLELPAEQWFDPADGLRTVRGLLDQLRHAPPDVPRLAGVLDDLEATERVLLAAEQHGVRFHLAIDF